VQALTSIVGVSPMAAPTRFMFLPESDSARGGRLAVTRVGADNKRWWMGLGSNQRRHTSADLQSAPFSHSGTHPVLACADHSKCKTSSLEPASARVMVEQSTAAHSSTPGQRCAVMVTSLVPVNEKYGAKHAEKPGSTRLPSPVRRPHGRLVSDRWIDARTCL
jgi:hypothetical protein